MGKDLDRSKLEHLPTLLVSMESLSISKESLYWSLCPNSLNAIQFHIDFTDFRKQEINKKLKNGINLLQNFLFYVNSFLPLVTFC